MSRLALSIFTAWTALATASAAHAGSFNEGPFDTPMQEIALADEDLDRQRGGFLLAGGLTIDFALFQQTLINGEIKNEIRLSTQELMDSLTPQNMHTLVQVGDGNTGFDAVANIPGVVTVISNTVDQTVIQNLSTLDLSVTNLNAMTHTLLSPLELQMIAGLPH